MNDPAYLLVFHGSRDPRPRVAATRLAELVRHQLAARRRQVSDPPLVDIASLELAEIPLSLRVERCARVARERGLSRLHVIPLFLLRGVHVTEDIRAGVSRARAPVPVEVKPFLGSYPGVSEIVCRQFASLPPGDRILLAHGSRRPGGCRIVESIARRAGATPAYRSVEPHWRGVVENRIDAGARSLVILPYFLFPGSATDEIEGQLSHLSQKYAPVQFFPGQPLGATEELARVIVGEVVGK